MSDLFGNDAPIQTVSIPVVITKMQLKLHRDERGDLIRVEPMAEPDETRAFVLRAVNAYLANGLDLQTQALRCLALTELVAGLIRHELTDGKPS